MVEVENEIGDALRDEPAHGAPGECFAVDRHGGLGAKIRQRPQTRPEAGR